MKSKDGKNDLTEFFVTVVVLQSRLETAVRCNSEVQDCSCLAQTDACDLSMTLIQHKKDSGRPILYTGSKTQNKVI